MKNLILFALLLTPLFLFSQTSDKNHIILLDGKIMNVIVIDANSTGVKYKITTEGELKMISADKVFIVLDESGDQVYFYGCEASETKEETTNSQQGNMEKDCGYVGGLDHINTYEVSGSDPECKDNHNGQFRFQHTAEFEIKIVVYLQTNGTEKYNLNLVPKGNRYVYKVQPGYYCYTVNNLKTNAVISKGELIVKECYLTAVEIRSN